MPAKRYSVVIVALPHFTFKFASLQAESSDPNAIRVAPSIGIAAGGPRIACRRTWHHEHAPNLSSCALQFARCTLLSWLEAQPTRMRAVEPIAIPALHGIGLGSTNLYSKVRRKLRSCSPIAFFSCFCIRFVRRCTVGQSASVRRSSVKTLSVLSLKISRYDTIRGTPIVTWHCAVGPVLS